MTRAARPLNTEITWFDQRRCYRFKYRDPFTGERKFINANAGQFEAAGIPLPDPEIVRKPTKTALTLAKQLQISFYASLQAVRPESFAASAPMISGAFDQTSAVAFRLSPALG